MTQEFLLILKSAKHNSWKTIITLDDSFFFFYMHTDFEQMWLGKDEAPKTESAI
jgi:hypothetical protein